MVDRAYSGLERGVIEKVSFGLSRTQANGNEVENWSFAEQLWEEYKPRRDGWKRFLIAKAREYREIVHEAAKSPGLNGTKGYAFNELARDVLDFGRDRGIVS